MGSFLETQYAAVFSRGASYIIKLVFFKMKFGTCLGFSF